MPDYIWKPLCTSILLIELVWIVVVEIRRYRKRKAELDSYANAIRFQPSKLRFAFSMLSYGIIFSIPLLLIFWWYIIVRGGWIGLLSIPLLILIGSMPSSYPYYTIIIRNGWLVGPTLWGWRREAIALNDIDKEKTLKRNAGKILGILVFYSLDGEKILSLGLSEAQIRQILEYPINMEEVVP